MTTNRLCWLLAAVVLLASIYASNAKAETNVFVGAWSKHLISSSDNLNEKNRLFAVEHDGWFAGTFTNSYYRESYAVARKFEWRSSDLRAGVYVGAVRGYTRCYGNDDSNSDVCPLVVPYVTYDAPVAPQIMLLGEALAISIKVRL